MDEPTVGFCDLCQARMTTLPGPAHKRDRRMWIVPSGYRIGYLVELAHRSFLICRDCIDAAVKAAA